VQKSIVYSLECNIRGGGGEDLKIDHLAQVRVKGERRRREEEESGGENGRREGREGKSGGEEKGG
jgi:hypothetical protein